MREELIRCAEVNHAQIEPHACLAEFDATTGRLTMQSVSQVGYYLHLMLARCLEMDTSRIRVIKPFIGGGFGARVEVLNFEIITALLARAAGGKVMMRLTREETFLTHRARPQTDIKLKLGMRRDGRITACECEVVQRGGAYAGYGIVTILYAGALLQGLYDIPAIKYDGYRVYANLPPCGAMRGHGSVDTRHAFECVLDRMAPRARPRPVRRPPRQSARRADPHPQRLDGQQLRAGGMSRSGRARQRLARAASDGCRRGKGLGMACSHYVSGAAKPIHWTGEPHAVVNVRLDFDGGVTALTGAFDIGQGSSTMVAIAVAETLGVALERVRVIAGDSAVTPKDNGAYSSRITFMVGNAAIDAANKLKAILTEAAAGKLEARAEEIDCVGRDLPGRCRRTIHAALRRRRQGGARRPRPASPSGAPSPVRKRRRAASIAAVRSARPWASATPPRWWRPASTRPPAWSRSTRSGSRSTAATPSIRSRSRDRSRARCGWAWARR